MDLLSKCPAGVLRFYSKNMRVLNGVLPHFAPYVRIIPVNRLTEQAFEILGLQKFEHQCERYHIPSVFEWSSPLLGQSNDVV